MPVLESDRLMIFVRKLQKKYSSEAFRYIYESLSPKLYFVCIRYLKDKDDAQDVLQESFVIIFERINSYKGNGSFEGWARKITVNQCINSLKRRRIDMELSDDNIPVEEPEQSNLPETEQNLRTKLKAAIMELPDGFRTIINMYVLEGFTHKEIAEVLNIKESTSRSQLNRAKTALKKIMLVEV